MRHWQPPRFEAGGRTSDRRTVAQRRTTWTLTRSRTRSHGRSAGRPEDDPDALLGAIVAALEAGGYTVTPPRPVLPVLPELPDGAQACPHVKDDGTVCGAPLNLWDKDPVQRSLYWEDGVGWIAGPSSSADDGGGDEEVQCYELHTWALPDIADWQ